MIAKFPVVSGIPSMVKAGHECSACRGNRLIQLLLSTTCADCLEEILSKLEALNASEFGSKTFQNIFGLRGGHQVIKVNPISLNSRRGSSAAHASARPSVLSGVNHTEPLRLLSFPSIYHPAFLAAVLPVTTFTPPQLSKSPRAGELESTSTNCGYSSSGRPVASDGWPQYVGFFAEQDYKIEFGPGDYRKGESMGQRRGDVNDRNAISDVHIFLRTHVMPSNEDPFHEFEDGWGIRFMVNDQIGRNQVKTIEDEEIADRPDENSPFTYHDDIDPAEVAGFSIRQT